MPVRPKQSEVDADIAAAIAHESALLRAGTANPIAVLRAICQVESRSGIQWDIPRHERAYCYGGEYYEAKTPGGEELRRLTVLFGCFAHMSYGPWQVLFVTAWENGFRGHPLELQEPKTCCTYAVRMLNQRCGAIVNPIPEDFFDAYNTGRPRDSRHNPKYEADALKAYTAFMGNLDA